MPPYRRTGREGIGARRDRPRTHTHGETRKKKSCRDDVVRGRLTSNMYMIVRRIRSRVHADLLAIGR